MYNKSHVMYLLAWDTFTARQTAYSGEPQGFLQTRQFSRAKARRDIPL